MSIAVETNEPLNVAQGPTHPDPYPYYARLACGVGLFHDPGLGCWVAATGAAVREVLESPVCFTRPVVGRLPEAIAEGAMGELFGRLVRLSDGPAHAELKPVVTAAVRGMDLAEAASAAHARADGLIAGLGGLTDAARVHRFLFALPVQVLMQFLGLPAARFAEVAGWLGDYGAATAAVVTGVPEPTAELVARGHAGAAGLLAAVADLDVDRAAAGPLFRAVMDAGEAAGCATVDLRANAAGLLAQGFVSVSGLAGLTLLALARRPQDLARIQADRSLLRRLMAEVLRADVGTHSTLRFVAQDTVIAGQPLKAGDKLFVMLAAAGLDPSLNADPQRFDMDRADPRTFEFGRGAHACPADRLAPLLAEIAVGRVLDAGLPLDRLEAALTYAASAHIRTPRFL